MADGFNSAFKGLITIFYKLKVFKIVYQLDDMRSMYVCHASA